MDEAPAAFEMLAGQPPDHLETLSDNSAADQELAERVAVILAGCPNTDFYDTGYIYSCVTASAVSLFGVVGSRSVAQGIERIVQKKIGSTRIENRIRTTGYLAS